ncbi:MAG TPA: DUF4271 domain-containing protein [Salinivirga sp.]|uniref:DUF4271 domain-containing protein n=1 Tax=Salinivirga sp. TaxID=1970192 RepID=UPI002B4A6AA2|nr:DUF4271 domain-containing protein [Salinivirga sp.]HKK60761.1 DUF4271 domain-containing protein [Salinivirga sp.]
MWPTEQDNLNVNSGYQQQKTQDFTVAVKGELPVYNALKGAYEPAEPIDESFTDQFRFEAPATLKMQINEHIYLPDYTYHKLELKPVNIFNPGAGFRAIEENKPKEWKTAQNKKIKEQGPHAFNALHGGLTYREKDQNVFKTLRPVPLVELTKEQKSYTREVNEIIRFSPVSKGQFQATDTMVGIIIGFILFFLYLRAVFGRHVRTFTKSVFNRVRAMNTLEEGNMIIGRVSFLLNIFFFFTLGLLFTHWLDYMGFVIWNYGQLKTFTLLSAIVTVLYIGKWIFSWIIGHFLKIQEETRAYFFHIFVFNKTFALVVFPFLLVLPYIDAQLGVLILKGSFILLGFFYLLRIIRLLTYSISRNVSLFYLFLYLCALEIIPILVIVKLSSEWLKLPVF